MIRAKVNLLIDVLLTLLLAAMAGLGFLIKWVLVPGYLRNAIYGRGVELYWLGLDRHQWGTVHLYLGVATLALLILHVVLHWGQVVTIYRWLIGSGGVRVGVAIVLLALIVALMAFPALVTPDVEEGGGHGAGRSAGQGARSPDGAENHAHEEGQGRGLGRGGGFRRDGRNE